MCCTVDVGTVSCYQKPKSALAWWFARTQALLKILTMDEDMLPSCFANIAFFPDLIQQLAEKFAIRNPATPTSSVYILGLIEACTFAHQSSLSKCDGPTVRYLSRAPVRLIV